MIQVHRNGRDTPLKRASLAEIEAEIADALDVTTQVQCRTDGHSDPMWQLAETVKGLAWALGSLALHYQDSAANRPTALTEETDRVLALAARNRI